MYTTDNASFAAATAMQLLAVAALLLSVVHARTCMPITSVPTVTHVAAAPPTQDALSRWSRVQRAVSATSLALGGACLAAAILFTLSAATLMLVTNDTASIHQLTCSRDVSGNMAVVALACVIGVAQALQQVMHRISANVCWLPDVLCD